MGKYVTRTLTDSEYKDLVRVIRCGYEYNKVVHRPNYQIATVLVLEANLGCRIGDIMELTTDSFVKDGEIWKLNIVEQKTGKHRSFIVPQPIKAFIDDYCRCCGVKGGKLFTIGSRAVHKQLRAATAYLGLQNVSTHSLRKKVANDIYESTGHDIEAVCSFLQHSSINTTRAYIRRSDSQLEAAITQTVSIA